MEQHPVPQPISSYEFRLIGSMTLKQFAKLAGSCLVALVFYALPLPGFLKMPLVALFVLLSLGMAFLPINERPLDVWIISFVKAVFSPTQYIWQKPLTSHATSSPPAPPPLPIQEQVPSQAPVVAKDSILPTEAPIPERTEAEFLQNIQALFEKTPLPKQKVVLKPPVIEEKIKGKVITAKIAQNNFGPLTPTFPNIITGMIKDKDGKLIENVIMEINDLQGLTVRALRSSKLGQFRTATPLPNGTYQISLEKEGYNFDIIKIELKGEIVPPIEINPK